MSKYPDKYDFPEQIINELIEKGKYYKGQKKDVFVVMLTGDKNHIKIDKNKIKKHKWVKFKELKEHLVFEGQYEHFLKVIKETIPQAINPEEKNNK